MSDDLHRETMVRASLTSAEVAITLKENMALASALHITGTPSYVVGDKVFVGAVGLDALKAQIAQLRRADEKAR